MDYVNDVMAEKNVTAKHNEIIWKITYFIIVRIISQKKKSRPYTQCLFLAITLI